MKSSKDITLQINPLFVGIPPILSPKEKKYIIKILIIIKIILYIIVLLYQ
jgi:hypothetical protein